MNVTLFDSNITRKSFLRTVLVTGIAPFVAPSWLRGGEITPPSAQINVACIGLGGIMSQDILAAAGIAGVNIVALCDVDQRAFAEMRQRIKKNGGDAVYNNIAKAKDYTDYRRLLEMEKALDAVIIATPDHWHAPICTAAIHAGKHVYCEKPLTHTIGEARRLRHLAQQSKVVTQMGNQGSASSEMRRDLEVIQAGVLGQVREVHIWHPPYPASSCGIDRPEGEHAVPDGLDWDFWVGPSPKRPFLRDLYHPRNWRHWYDFGNGSLGDFCGHAFNLPVRALQLGYPTAIEVSGTGLGKESYVKSCHLAYHFPARGNLAPAEVHFYHAGLPPAAALEGIAETFGEVSSTGCVLIGDKGTISAGLWNANGYLKMKGEKKFKGIMNHEAAKPIPQTLPRVRGHMPEWIDACRGKGTTFSDFETGGRLTEIGLSGILALRAGHRIEWDGDAMKVAGMPEFDRLIQPEYRAQWRS